VRVLGVAWGWQLPRCFWLSMTATTCRARCTAGNCRSLSNSCPGMNATALDGSCISTCVGGAVGVPCIAHVLVGARGCAGALVCLGQSSWHKLAPEQQLGTHNAVLSWGPICNIKRYNHTQRRCFCLQWVCSRPMVATCALGQVLGPAVMSWCGAPLFCCQRFTPLTHALGCDRTGR
jgi:hypothetical protein